MLVAALYLRGTPGSGTDRVSRAAQTVVTQVDAYFHRDGPLLGQGSPSAQEGLTTDGHTSTGARWDQATAKVYLDPTMDETFTRAYEEALESWNQTGAYTFQLVTSEEEANILLTEMDDSTVSAAGEAESQTNVLTNRFKRVTVRLNRYYLLNKQYNYSHQRIVNTAEHELGHAIGLDHTEEESVMQAAGSFYSIQARDIEAVRQLYKE